MSIEKGFSYAPNTGYVGNGGGSRCKELTPEEIQEEARRHVGSMNMRALVETFGDNKLFFTSRNGITLSLSEMAGRIANQIGLDVEVVSKQIYAIWGPPEPSKYRRKRSL